MEQANSAAEIIKVLWYINQALWILACGVWFFVGAFLVKDMGRK